MYMPGMVSAGYAQYGPVCRMCSFDKRVKETRDPSEKGAKEAKREVSERFLPQTGAIP